MRFTFYEVSCKQNYRICTILCQSLIDFRYNWMTDSISFVLAGDEALKIDHIADNVAHGFRIISQFPVECGSVHSLY